MMKISRVKEKYREIYPLLTKTGKLSRRDRDRVFDLLYEWVLEYTTPSSTISVLSILGDLTDSGVVIPYDEYLHGNIAYKRLYRILTTMVKNKILTAMHLSNCVLYSLAKQ